MSKRKVVVVDDHAAVRAGIRAVLERSGSYEVVAERDSSDGLEVVLWNAEVDVLIIDFKIPAALSTTAVISRVTRLFPKLAVLVFSGFEDGERVQAAMLAGADGYLPKSVHIDKLLEAIESVCAGETYVHPRLQRALVELAVNASSEQHRAVESLSPREHEVLTALARGLENKEIAAHVGVSVGTIKTYLSRICKKLGLTRRTQAALFGAKSHGLERASLPRVGEEKLRAAG